MSCLQAVMRVHVYSRDSGCLSYTRTTVFKMVILVPEIVVVSAASLCVSAVSLEDLYPNGFPQDKYILCPLIVTS